jgi:hypothetical protein
MSCLCGGGPKTARVTTRRIAASSVLLGQVFTGIASAWGSLAHVWLHGVLALGLVSLVVIHLLGVSTTTWVSELIARLVWPAHLAAQLLARVGARILGGVGVGLIVSVVCVLELVWLHFCFACKVS